MLGRSGDVASILQDATPSPRRSPGILKDRLAAWIWQGGFGQVDLTKWIWWIPQKIQQLEILII
jgi:hypothetical protein